MIAAPDLSLIAITNSASPQKSMAEQLAAYQVEQQRMESIRAELDLTAQQIDDIRAYMTADVDALFPTLTANQRKFFTVQRAVLRYLAKKELREIAE